MVKVLVTGGGGLIGSHLVKKLLGYGYDVRVADNFSRGNIDNLKDVTDKIEIHNVDLAFYRNCVNAVKGVDWVFHLAAKLAGVEAVHSKQSDYYTPNILMNTYMLEAAKLENVDRYLFTSTACIYRVEDQMKPDAPPLKEEWAFPAHAESSYGWVKLLHELQCKSYAKDYGMKIALPRLFNVYGEGEYFGYGSHVIPELIRKAILYPSEDFIVYGDGTATRDFTYVEDAVEGLIEVMERYAVADPINLGGSPDGRISIKDLAYKIIEISGKDIKPKFDPSKPTGVIGRAPDCSKARKVLRWRPKTPLDVGLKRTYKWMMERWKERWL